MTDDPKLLRAEADYYHGEWQKAVAENEKLRAALNPFAETDTAFYAGEKDYYVCTAVWFSLGQYRAAAAALKETGNDKVDG